VNSSSIDVLIVGGGLAGSAAAIKLAQADRGITLVEKESRPHNKVCGEFLSHEALIYLKHLGVDPIALGAVPITSVRLAGRLSVSESTLPFAALSLTRSKLDEELLRLAEMAGTKIRRGLSVHYLEQNDEGWKATLQGGSSITARTMFLATGKHDLHGRARPAGVQSDLIAFKMYWRLAASEARALEGHVELNLYNGGYAGLQPVEDGVANLCCLIRRADFRRLGGRWDSLLQAMQDDCPHLKQRLRGATPLLNRALAISSIPYGFVRSHTEGLWALGDQAAVIPSFTGDGMSIALHSGQLAAEMYLRGKTEDDFQRSLHKQLRTQVSLATMLSRGLVLEPYRTLMEGLARFWPGLLTVTARRTRLSAESMLPAREKLVAVDGGSVGC
jgi:flavin-dependent dehydrogenase